MIDAYPETIRVALLDSPLIPETAPLPYLVHADRLFDRLARECLEDADCASDYGDMRINLNTALSLLEDTPLLLPYPYWDTLSDDTKFLLTRDRLSELVEVVFYADYLVWLLPALLRDLARTGESTFALRFVNFMLEFQKDEEFAIGLNRSITCREQIPYIQDVEPTRSGIEWYKSSAGEWADDICDEVWNVGLQIPPKPPGGFDHPVLLLTGVLDPITPAEPAAALAARVLSVQHVTIIGSHGGLISTQCGLDVAWQFMRNPRAPVTVPSGCEWEQWWL